MVNKHSSKYRWHLSCSHDWTLDDYSPWRVIPVWSGCGLSPDRTGCLWRPCQGSGHGPPWVAPGTRQTSSGSSCNGSPSSSPEHRTEEWWEEQKQLIGDLMKLNYWKTSTTFRGRTYRITPFCHQGVKFLLIEPAKQTIDFYLPL